MPGRAEYLKRFFLRTLPPPFRFSAAGLTVVLAGVVGVAAGLLTLATTRGVNFLHAHVFVPLQGSAVPSATHWRMLGVARTAVPLTAVFLLVAYALRRWAPEAAGSGMEQVMDAVGRRGGYIRGRVVGMKAAATILGVGAGAPLGLEGPVVQIGAAVGSLTAWRFELDVRHVRILVASGAAAAMAAAYGAPIGGAVLSAELILGSTGMAALLPLILASVLAVGTRHLVAGRAPELVIPALRAFGAADYVLFVVLGVFCGLASAGFIKLLFATDDAMAWLLRPWWMRALFGCLLVGVAGALMPALLGTSQGAIQGLIQSPNLPVLTLILLIVLKPLLCSVATASGMSGGVFAPSLLVGAALGALFARVAGAILPVEVAPATTYVVAGMAGVMGSVMRAPLQAILVTFELAHSYALVPSLMLTCVVAMKVSEFLEAESAFTGRLRRKGENLRAGMDFSLLDGLAVKDVMDRDYVALPAGALITEIADLVSAAENRTFPVAGEDGRLVGIVTLANLIGAGTRSAHGNPVPTVMDLMRRTPAYLEPEDPLGPAWDKMGHFDYDCLPVCRPGPDGPNLVGICEKEAISEMHDRQTFIRMHEGLRPHQGREPRAGG